MEQKIPVLNCLWNDVLHCSPIDLRLIYKALIRAGHHKVKNIVFLKIPIELLKNIEFAKYKFDKEVYDKEKKAYVLTTEDIESLTIGSYRELNELPNKTIEWYKQCAESSRKPLLFRYIPHIFVKGNIPIKEVDVCAGLINLCEMTLCQSKFYSLSNSANSSIGQGICCVLSINGQYRCDFKIADISAKTKFLEP